MTHLANHAPAATPSGYSRRSFLGMLGLGIGASGAVLAHAAQAYGAPENDLPSRPGARAILFDASKCVGCHYCEAACKNANDLPADVHVSVTALADKVLPKQVIPYEMLKEDAKHPLVVEDDRDGSRYLRVVGTADADGNMSYLRHACMHCGLCATVCPSGALKQRDDGVVTLDKDRCIGCFYCYQACPFNIPRYNEASDDRTMRKCTQCAERVDDGGKPACVEACPAQALQFGDFDELARAGAEAARNLGGDATLYGAREGGGMGSLYVLPHAAKTYKLADF